MPAQNPITPATLADQLDVTIITLRRWSSEFADHLSASANPGAGQNRRYSYRDREVLRYVRSQRDIGRSLAEIADQLAGLTFPEIDDSPPGGSMPDTVPDGNVTAVTASQGAPVESLAQYDVMRLSARLETLEQSSRASWWWLIAGIGIGLGLAAVAELAAIVASRVH